MQFSCLVKNGSANQQLQGRMQPEELVIFVGTVGLW
jgi:hypothetical protein